MSPANAQSQKENRRGVRAAAGVIVLAAGAAYANTLAAPFVYDDLKSITQNPTIRQLWPLGPVLVPPPGGGLSGRPLANLTFAFNYALGGESPAGYHAFNLLIHVLAALVLFGVVRRTLLRPGLGARYGAVALPLAWAAAILWAVHPLQTEAVTYVSQRTELLMGLGCLLTVYAFVRGVDSPSPGKWLGLSVAACLLGAACKEPIVTAPLLVLVYDRTLVAGTFRAAWRVRWRYYLGLAGSWVLLAWLMRDLGTRHVGFGLGVPAWNNLLTEGRAVVHYLGLAVWPHPLVFDYGAGLLPCSAATLACLLLLGLLAAAVARAVGRGSALGLAGAWIFLTLAPASSFVPVVLQPVAEHRMYLPLAGVVVLVMLGLHALFGRRTVAAVAVLAAGLGFLTAQRNATYHSELALWSDTVAQRPGNARAQTNLGSALARAGRLGAAREHLAEAVRLEPGNAAARFNLANVLLELGRPADALVHCEAAVRLRPDSPEAHCVLGGALMLLDRLDAAQAQFEAALRLQPDHPVARENLRRLWGYRAGQTRP